MIVRHSNFIRSSVIALAAVFYALCSCSTASALTYGSKIRLKTTVSVGGSNRYLSSLPVQYVTGGYALVGSPALTGLSSDWIITSPTGKTGTVKSGDKVILQEQANNRYLTTVPSTSNDSPAGSGQKVYCSTSLPTAHWTIRFKDNNISGNKIYLVAPGSMRQLLCTTKTYSLTGYPDQQEIAANISLSVGLGNNNLWAIE